MIIIRALIPFIFVLLISGVYAAFFNKKIEEALAPAFFMHVLLMLFSAMLLDSLIAGCVLGMVLALFAGVYVVKKRGWNALVAAYRISRNNIGVVLITTLYVLIYVINYGSVYSDWDEFSHWGIFVKEMFRTDMLYCTSTAMMDHKDYVPAISIFETLWCRLSMKYSESNAYRGIQMLQTSMLLPLLTIKTSDNDNSNDDLKSVQKSNLELVLNYIVRGLLVYGIPMFFGNFYHTIYQDLIYGIIVFYCMYIIITEKEGIYKAFVLTLSLTVLLLSKMTAMAFLPMLVIFYIVWSIKFESVKIKHVFERVGATVVIPVSLWIIVNKYINMYVGSSGTQSYGGISIQDFVDVFTHNGSISYQHVVDQRFILALFTQGVVTSIPYVFWVILILAFLLVVKKSQEKDLDAQRKIELINLWIVLATVSYTVMMYYLYMTAFDEYEATNLASYSRYMGTMSLIIVMLGLLVLFMYENKQLYVMKVCLTAIVLENLLLFIDTKQLLPGAILDESIPYESEAKSILSHSDDDSSVLLVVCGSSGGDACTIRYLCSPRRIEWISPGESRYNGDIWSKNLSENEFVEYIGKYDYLYLLDIDDDFLNQYNTAFVLPEKIVNHRLYSSNIIEGKIYLTDVENE